MKNKFTPKFKVGQTVFISDTFHEDVIEDVVISIRPSDSQDHNCYHFDSREHYSEYYEIDVFGSKSDAQKRHVEVMTRRLVDDIKDANRCIKAISKCCGNIDVSILDNGTISAFDNHSLYKVV